jgi:hypothetical protein
MTSTADVVLWEMSIEGGNRLFVDERGCALTPAIERELIAQLERRRELAPVITCIGGGARCRARFVTPAGERAPELHDLELTYWFLAQSCIPTITVSKDQAELPARVLAIETASGEARFEVPLYKSGVHLNIFVAGTRLGVCTWHPNGRDILARIGPLA